MDYITACAIIKDEGPYLAEWIAYHRLMGVTRFILYDNGSRIPLSQSVAPFTAKNDITVIPFEGRGRQMQAYTECIGRVARQTVWLSLTDIDEYLVPIKASNLIQVLKPYEGYGALGVNWQTFGSAGHKERPKGLQVNNFTSRAPEQWDWNKHIKSIIRPLKAIKALSPHHCAYKDGEVCVNEKHESVQGPFSIPVSKEVIQVNHYFTRSRKEYDDKLARGAADGTYKSIEFFDIVDRVATEKDLTITKFSVNLKNYMKSLGVQQ